MREQGRQKTVSEEDRIKAMEDETYRVAKEKEIKNKILGIKRRCEMDKMLQEAYKESEVEVQAIMKEKMELKRPIPRGMKTTQTQVVKDKPKKWYKRYKNIGILIVVLSTLSQVMSWTVDLVGDTKELYTLYKDIKNKFLK